MLDAGRLVRAEQRRQMPAQHRLGGTAEQLEDVGADLAHLEIGFAHDGEHAPWLNAARDVDGLAGTIVQVDRRAGGQGLLHLLGVVAHGFGTVDVMTRKNQAS